MPSVDPESQSVSIEESISSYEDVLEVESAMPKKIAKTVGLTFLTCVSVTFFILNNTTFQPEGLAGRVTRTSTSFASGTSLGGLLSYILPKGASDQFRLEAWRLGIPAYFLLTQLYLNVQDHTEQEWLIDTMLFLWGVQLATLVNAYVTPRFHDWLSGAELSVIDKSGRRPVGDPDDRFRLLTDLTPTARTVKLVGMFALGGGMVGSSFAVDDQISSHLLRDFGSFLLAESITVPLWEIFVAEWGNRLEQAYEAQIQSSIQPMEPSLKLKFYRGLNRTLQIGLPLSIIALFYKPQTATLAVAGGLHGIQDEIYRYPFTHRPLSKIHCVKTRLLQQGRVQKFADLAWRITRVGGEAIGLGYFGYLVFGNGSQVDDFAIGTFLASTTAGYLSNLLVDRNFTPLESSSLMQTLFFRTLRSPEILGIEPLYFYYYTVNYPIDIGSGSLSDITLQQGTIAFISWGAYGLRLGQDLAAFESNRFEETPRLSNWLVYSNMVAMIQRLEGVIH